MTEQKDIIRVIESYFNNYEHIYGEVVWRMPNKDSDGKLYLLNNKGRAKVSIMINKIVIVSEHLRNLQYIDVENNCLSIRFDDNLISIHINDIDNFAIR